MSRRPALLAVVLSLVIAAGIAKVALRPSVLDWPEYLGGPDRGHYSPLRRINRGNVARLRLAWTYHSGDFGLIECNPLVIGGVLFGTTAKCRIFALDAATGREKWRFFDPANPDTSGISRGVAYWSDGRSRRILGVIGSWLYALDAGTGQPIPDFGFGGRVSLKAGLGPQAQAKWVGSTSPGTVFGDLVIMPTTVSEDWNAAPGSIQAFNVRTGTLAWTFHTIPYPGEPGYETWPTDTYRNIDVGSANCWTGMAIDRRRGILYVPTGSAAPDFWGGQRLGKNLFSDCLLALDAATGKLLWHFQCFHHDIWDRDLPAPPVLLTVRRGGRLVDAVAQTTKVGYIFVFDRVTGQPLFPVREMPVPKSDLPGEAAWPTQPKPDSPAPFIRQMITEADINPLARNRSELIATLRRLRAGVFQPVGKEPILLVPGPNGGAEWGGPAADANGILYVNANELPYLVGPTASVKPDDFARFSYGHRLYAENCVSCHGPERRGNPATGFPSLVGVAGRLTRDPVLQVILAGRGRMPGFPVLSEYERAAIADFLLGTESSGGPPPSAAEGGRPPELYSRGPDIDWAKFLDNRGYPAISPPWGTLNAIDLNTGHLVWKIPLGEYKALTAEGQAPTGTENYGGPIVTAGGVLFIAATADHMFRAFDRETGTLLWQTELPASGCATPSTYAIAGRQYVVIACGGSKAGSDKKGDSYVAFALP